MSEQDLLGYVPYLAMIFLPGLGFGELLGVWKPTSSFIERTGVAFGIGLAIDSAILFVRTSGISLLGYRLVGIDLDTVYFIISVGLVLLALSLSVRRRFSFYVRPQRVDIAVLAVMLALSGMLLAFFAKYPIFPEYQSQDFGNHVVYSTALIAGTTTSIPTGILYWGVEYQLASSILLVGGQALVTVRFTMALLLLLSPLLVYLASNTLFNNRTAAILATIIYAFSGTLWFDSIFNSGLYANFFGFLACLFLLTAFVDLTMRSRARWCLYSVALIMAYLSHYSTLTIFPAMLLAALLEFLFDRRVGKRYLLPAIIPVVPIVLVVIAYPGYVQQILSAAIGGGGGISGSTTLSSALAPIPVLGYLAVEVYDDIAFVVFLALASVYAYKSGTGKRGLFFIPLFWVLTVLISSPEDVNAWRFSFMAVLPLILIAGMGIVYLFPASGQGARKRSKLAGPRVISGTKGMVLISLAFVALLVIGSWGTTMLTDSFSDTQLNANAQTEVFQTIQWLGNNTGPNSTYLSVSDWRFTYTSLMIGRDGYYQFESTPQQAVPEANSLGAQYIIVTNLVTASLPAEPSLFPWNNFKATSNMTMVYSNPDVEVFEIV